MVLIHAGEGIGEVLCRVIELLHKENIVPCIVMDGDKSVAFKDQETHDQYVLKLIKSEE